MTTSGGWEDAWREKRTPWDKGEPAPALVEALDRYQVTPCRALVPGCGAGYDVALLGRAGFVTIGLDIAETARALFEERNPDRGASEIRGDDFFSFAPEAPFGLVFDYTFLCAIPLERRIEWAAKMASLIAPGGELWSLVYPIRPEADPTAGPPFPLDPASVIELLASTFRPVDAFVPARNHPGREGAERFIRFIRIE